MRDHKQSRSAYIILYYNELIKESLGRLVQVLGRQLYKMTEAVIEALTPLANC